MHIGQKTSTQLNSFLEEKLLHKHCWSIWKVAKKVKKIIFPVSHFLKIHSAQSLRALVIKNSIALTQ
jgi:hypothetical protein